MSKYISSSYPLKSANGIVINTDYIQTHNCNIKSGRNISYIVMHYTGNSKDTAVGNAKYFYNSYVEASAHYFVDDNTICASVPEYYSCWGVGVI